MRRALLVSYLSTHFMELQRVAAAMKKSGRWEPVFHFARAYPEAATNAKACDAAGWAWTSAVPLAGPAAGASGPGWRARVLDAMRGLPSPAKQVLRWSWRYAKRRRSYRALAKSWRPFLGGTSLVVLAEDNLDYMVPVLIREAHEGGVPTVIVPFTIANALEPAEAYLGNEARTVGFFDGPFAKRYPQWVYEHRGHRLLRLPAAEALATEHLGLAPPKPWILNSGNADAIAVESPAMLAHYRACGLPESQLVLTGALYNDVLAEAGREAPALRRSLGLDDRPVILVALPPDQVESRTRQQCDFTTHDALARYWIATLAASKDFQVVVSLHPRIPRESMAFIESSGAKIADVDIARLVPVAALFVASVSATIRLAIACGVPVINYDVYRYRYTDYAGMPGVRALEDRAAFEAEVQRLTTDPSALEVLGAAQRSVMGEWALLDGGAEARMLALFDRLASARGAPA